ncbi:unnamed protein product [Auanema sp. JU1783]|nr:unnamed protein product [Auanema sp. JU1783]
MPFLSIDTSTYDSSETIRKQLIEKFAELNYIIHLTSKFLGIYQNAEKPKGNLSTILHSIKQVWSCFLLFLLFLGFMISVTLTSVAVTSLYLIGLIDFLFLFYYNWSHFEYRFFRSLMHSSTGVGILKQFKMLNRIKNISIFISLAIVAAVLLLVSLSLFKISQPVLIDMFKINDDVIRIFYMACFGIIMLSTPAANCICFLYISQVISEYEIFNADFETDANTYQIAVARHYAHAHNRIYKSFQTIERPISYWVSSHILINLVIVLKSIHYLSHIQIDERNAITNLCLAAPTSFYLVSCLFQSICILYVALDIRHQMTRLKQLMFNLLIGQRILHDQTYSLCIACISHFHIHKYGISFFRLTIIDRQFINFICFGCFLILFLSAHQESG